MSRQPVLNLGPNLKLPALEAQTQTLVVYGGKGMGKTNFAAALAEEFAKNNLRFSWIDPVGVAWGLKHSADGRGPGVSVLILGGIHGDMPIEPTGGEVVADLVVDEDVSVIVDISRHASGKMWTHADKIRFVRDYCTRLFERQGERRRPIMQIIDEAGRFVPQSIQKGMEDVAACMGAIEQLVELGRNVGVGVALITQRSARMNKSVSELAEMMVAFRTVGPRSIDAIVDWFGEHVPRDQQKTLVERLRQLDRGTALIVAPGWLRLEGEYALRARETFDSSETPVAGQERVPTGKGAQVDIDKYLERMAEVVERAEANDPKVQRDKVAKAMKRLTQLEAELDQATTAAAEAITLRQTVADLERALGEEIDNRDRLERKLDEFAYTIAPQEVIGEHSSGNDPWANAIEHLLNQPQVVDVPVLDPDLILRLEAVLAPATELMAQVQERLSWESEQRGDKIVFTRTVAEPPPRPTRERPVIPDRPAPVTAAPKTSTPQPVDPPGDLSKQAMDMLRALAAMHPRRLGVPEWGAQAKASPKSSNWKPNVRALRNAGFIDVGSKDVGITQAGLDLLGADVPAPKTPAEIVEMWVQRLPAQSGVMLRRIFKEERPISEEELSEVTGYSMTSSNWKPSLRELRKNDLIRWENGEVWIADYLRTW